MNSTFQLNAKMPPVFLLTLSLLTSVHAGERGNTALLEATHGVIVGEVSADSAVIWGRASRQGFMQLTVKEKTVAPNPDATQHHQIEVTAASDFTGKIQVSKLRAQTPYEYSVFFSREPGFHAPSGPQAQGRFVTAPAREAKAAIKFAWGGDLAGQNVCRDVEKGFPIFSIMPLQDYDFFIGLGDMIYADGVCKARGLYGNDQVPGGSIQSVRLKDFWSHWKYSREDPAFLKLLQTVPYYSVWDDHEVVNDFGPGNDVRDFPPYKPGEHLLPAGLRAYLDYNPIHPPPETPHQLYRSVDWGKHLTLVFLDNRQYRDLNTSTDGAGSKKSMLGREQRAWLKKTLRSSNATWKVIASSVPISIPTGPDDGRRDGWANYQGNTGFENEFRDILRFLEKEKINNVMFITTDVHFATGFRYRPFTGSNDYTFYEFMTGPLNAGAFAREEFDNSFHPERLFIYGKNSFKDFDEAIRYMNYGEITINEAGELTVRVINGSGDMVYKQTLSPS